MSLRVAARVSVHLARKPSVDNRGAPFLRWPSALQSTVRFRLSRNPFLVSDTRVFHSPTLSRYSTSFTTTRTLTLTRSLTRERTLMEELELTHPTSLASPFYIPAAAVGVCHKGVHCSLYPSSRLGKLPSGHTKESPFSALARCQADTKNALLTVGWQVAKRPHKGLLVFPVD